MVPIEKPLDLYIYSHHRLKEYLDRFIQEFLGHNELNEPCFDEYLVEDDEGETSTWRSFGNKRQALEFGLECVSTSFSVYFQTTKNAAFKTVIIGFTFDGGIVYGFSFDEADDLEELDNLSEGGFINSVKSVIKGADILKAISMPPPSHFEEFHL